MLQRHRTPAASFPVTAAETSAELRAFPASFLASPSGSVEMCLGTSSVYLLDAGSRVLGLPPLEGWALIGGAIVVVALFLGWAFLRRAQRRGASEDLFDSSGRPAK